MSRGETAKGGESPLMVTTSALGKFAFCPEASRLNVLGVRPHSQARHRMARGEAAHGHWQQREDRVPERESRLGLLALIVAAALLLLSFFWAMTGP